MKDSPDSLNIDTSSVFELGALPENMSGVGQSVIFVWFVSQVTLPTLLHYCGTPGLFISRCSGSDKVSAGFSVNGVYSAYLQTISEALTSEQRLKYKLLELLQC